MVMLRFNTFPINSIGSRGLGARYLGNVPYAAKFANIIVQIPSNGKLVDVNYDVTFAFKAFRPDGTLHLN